MKQDEVIRDLLQKSPPTVLAAGVPDGFKAISRARIGAVDADAITAWVEAHGGRGEHHTSETPGDATNGGSDGSNQSDLVWILPESALEL